MYVTYTRIYGWSDYGGESSYQPGYRLENMMWMTLLVYDYIIPGDYYIPCLILPTEKEQPIGLWGQRHLHYLKEYHRLTYTNLLTSGRLNEYLAEIDKQAKDMFLRLIKQMSEREGVTEQLKTENQMEWVGRMNNIRSRAVEIVNAELIYS